MDTIPSTVESVETLGPVHAAPARRHAKPRPLRRRVPLGRHPGTRPARRQARAAQFLRRGAGGLPHRYGCDRPAIARRVLRSQTGDRHRPRRAHGRAERGLSERGGRQRPRFLRHAFADGHSPDRAPGRGAVRAGGAAARDAGPSCSRPSFSAARSNAGSVSPFLRGTTPRVGTSPPRAAYSAPRPAPAS